MIRENVLLIDKVNKLKLKGNMVQCWPRDNTFFSEGVASLFKMNRSFLELHNLLFVDFQKCNLTKLIEFDFYINASKSFDIVLVTDNHMFPIAQFMSRLSSIKIVSIIKTTTPVNQVLNHVINDVLMPANTEKRLINLNDIDFIRYCLSGESIPTLSRRTGVNIKTLYGRRSRLLKMMGVNSIATLLL